MLCVSCVTWACDVYDVCLMPVWCVWYVCVDGENQSSNLRLLLDPKLMKNEIKGGCGYS